MSLRGVLKIISIVAAVFPALVLHTHAGGGDQILLRLPVRVYVDSLPRTGLNRDDFTLWINGRKREIRNSLPREKVFAAPRGARDLILAIDASGAGPQLSEGIARLLDRFVRQTDRLYLLTPLNNYSIDTAADKSAAVDRINQIIRGDSGKIVEEKKSALENLRTTVDNFIEAASGRKRDVKYARNHARIMLFLSNFHRLWTEFRDNYLLPDLSLMDGLVSKLAPGAGERWMIHLQRPDPPTIWRQFQRAAGVIRAHIAAPTSETPRDMTDSIRRGLQTVEDAMSVRRAFPEQEMLRSLAGAEITYLPVTLGEADGGESGNGWSSGYRAAVMDMARLTGGTDIVATDLTTALDRLAQARDVYYDLVFPFDGLVEDKQIRVTVPQPDATLWYRKRFLKGEVQTLADHFEEPDIRVLDFSIAGHAIKFSITGFKIETRDTQKSGAVQVTVELVDNKRRTVYTTRNTLRAEREPITVSLNLPAKHRGYFQLRIEALDILCQKSAQIKKYVKL